VLNFNPHERSASTVEIYLGWSRHQPAQSCRKEEWKRGWPFILAVLAIRSRFLFLSYLWALGWRSISFPVFLGFHFLCEAKMKKKTAKERKGKERSPPRKRIGTS